MLCFAGSAAADHTSVYNDPLGDVDEAPDYTRVRAISRPPGTLIVGAQVANRTYFEQQDSYSFWFDTDGDASTFDEVVLQIHSFGPEEEFDVYAFFWDSDLGMGTPVDLPAEFGWGAGPFVEIPFREWGLDFGDRIDFRLTASAFFPGVSAEPDLAPGPGPGFKWAFQIRRCDLEGTGKDDRLTSGQRGDWICGFGGDDRLRGRGGDDLIYGGRGADRLNGGSGVDVLEGGRGSDNIRAGSGPDSVNVKGGGADVVRCGPGFDGVEADTRDELIGCEDVLR